MSVSTLRPLLPLGSVVVLHNGDVKLMIIGRVPLYRDESIFGYFDYMAMRYPVGLTRSHTLTPRTSRRCFSKVSLMRKMRLSKRPTPRPLPQAEFLTND